MIFINRVPTLAGRTKKMRSVGKPRTSLLRSVLAKTGMILSNVTTQAEKRCDCILLNFQAGAYVRPSVRNMTQSQQ